MSREELMEEIRDVIGSGMRCIDTDADVMLGKIIDLCQPGWARKRVSRGGNCRNCKWADWYRYPKSRRISYMHFAECKAPIDFDGLPASLKRHLSGDYKKLHVVSYENVPVDCGAWEKQS